MFKGGYQSDLSMDEKVLMAIVGAGDFFRKEHAAIFRNYGLTFSQYNVLRVLDASEKGQNAITKISKIMLVTGANMTGIAKRLEKNGFLIRKGDPGDERVTLLEITPKGRQALKNIEAPKEGFIRDVLKDLSEGDKRLIFERLSHILRHKETTIP